MRAFALFIAVISAVLVSTHGAQAARFTFVSGNGVDTGVCPSNAPCRTIAYALKQTNVNGEVHALDAADYGAATIVRSVRLIGVPGATMGRASDGDVVYIGTNAGLVEITGFIIEGGYDQPITGNGISSVGLELTVKDCIIRNINGAGINIHQPAQIALIEDTTIERVQEGIHLDNISNFMDVAINRVSIVRIFGDGIGIGYNSAARVADSYIAFATGNGIYVHTKGFLSLQTSTVVAVNGYGVVVSSSGAAQSSGNNSLISNGTGKVSGTMTLLGQN